MWHTYDLKDRYDVVIIGAGVHGLAAAYYLARNYGITDVAVLDRGYMGGGNSGRNTAIVRSNYLTPEGVRFYNRSVKLYEELAADLNFNVMFSQSGHLTLAHTDSSLRTMRWRAEVNKLEGVRSEVIDPQEIKRLVPYLDVSQDVRYPILGALYHAPGGSIRHDAVNWGYARGADACGIHIHQKTEVTGIDVEHDRVVSVQTTRGKVATRHVLNCTAGWCSVVAAMAGGAPPIVTLPPQAPGGRPGRHLFRAVVGSGPIDVFFSPTPRRGLVFGARDAPRRACF